MEPELPPLNRPTLPVIIAAGSLIALVVVLILSIGSARDAANQARALAAEGRQVHAAMCVYKADLEQRLDDNRAYLKMTQAERTAKYGKALAHVPASVVQRGIATERDQLHSLRALRCP